MRSAGKRTVLLIGAVAVLAWWSGPAFGDLTTVGARAESMTAAVSFDGSSLTVSGASVSTVQYLDDAAVDTSDVVVGAAINIPSLAYGGLKTYSNGIWKFDYYCFDAVPGSEVTLTTGSTTYLSASVQQLWYLPHTRAFSIGLSSPAYNNSVVSDYLDTLGTYVGQSDVLSEMFLWLTIFPHTDFEAETGFFADSYAVDGAMVSVGVCGRVPGEQPDYPLGSDPPNLCTVAYNPFSPGNVRCVDNGCKKLGPNYYCKAYDSDGSGFLDSCKCVPAPGAFLLGTMGLTVIGWVRRRGTVG